MVDFSEDDWSDLLAALRIEVIRAGYGDWDRSALSGLESKGQAASFEDYLTKLIGVLKIGSSAYRNGVKAGLSEMLVDAESQPVVDAYLVDDEGFEQASLLDGRATDDLLSVLSSVRSDLFGGGGGYYGGGR